MPNEKPVTQEFLIKLILRIILWCAFLAVVALIGYGIYDFDQRTKANAERNTESLNK